MNVLHNYYVEKILLKDKLFNFLGSISMRLKNKWVMEFFFEIKGL